MSRARRAEEGFAISVEMLLIAVVLVVGLITGWVKLRDQSLAEIKDSMAAIDAYILGSGPLWQTGGTRWIEPCHVTPPATTCDTGTGSIDEPSSSGAVTERWSSDGFVTSSSLVTAAETAPGSHIYQVKDGILIYAAPTPE